MNADRSETTVMETLPLCVSPISLSLAVTASATCTVLAIDVLETESDSAGWPLVRA